MTDIADAKVAPERLRVAVTLEVITRVTVEIDTSSDQTVDEMRSAALTLFDRAGGMEYRNQFRSNTAINLRSMTSRVAQLETLAPRAAGDW